MNDSKDDSKSSSNLLFIEILHIQSNIKANWGPSNKKKELSTLGQSIFWIWENSRKIIYLSCFPFWFYFSIQDITECLITDTILMKILLITDRLNHLELCACVCIRVHLKCSEVHTLFMKHCLKHITYHNPYCPSWIRSARRCILLLWSIAISIDKHNKYPNPYYRNPYFPLWIRTSISLHKKWQNNYVLSGTDQQKLERTNFPVNVVYVFYDYSWISVLSLHAE